MRPEIDERVERQLAAAPPPGRRRRGPAQVVRQDRVVTASDLRLAGPVTCPRCGDVFQGSWTADRKAAAAQQCARCLHVFTAAWPGFRFAPETVIDQPGSGGDRHVPATR